MTVDILIHSLATRFLNFKLVNNMPYAYNVDPI